MKPTVDQEKCIGCGLCISMCPDCFEWENSKSKVKDECVCEGDSCCKDAEESCPTKAIEVK
jgi:ferredoxin